MHVIAQEAFSGLQRPSLIIQSLDDSREFQFAPDAQIYPASMIKVPIAAAVAAAIARGRISTDAIEVEARLVTTEDSPSPFVPGYRSEVWELIEHMLLFSNNTATNMLIDRIGRTYATELCREFGLADTAVRHLLSGSLPRIADPDTTGENEHPTRDAALLLRLIAEREIPDAAKLEAILVRQFWNSKLSAGLNSGDVFAHKTGDTSDTSHDGGILNTASGKRFVVVLYSQSPSNDATDAAFAQAMRNLRPLLS